MIANDFMLCTFEGDSDGLPVLGLGRMTGERCKHNGAGQHQSGDFHGLSSEVEWERVAAVPVSAGLSTTTRLRVNSCLVFPAPYEISRARQDA